LLCCLRTSIVAGRTVDHQQPPHRAPFRRCALEIQITSTRRRSEDLNLPSGTTSYKNEKYNLGRALVGKDPIGENLKRVAESQGIQYLGKDLVAFSDGTVFDCIYDFDGPKARWQFQLSH
jgi:hypothetical protein